MRTILAFFLGALAGAAIAVVSGSAPASGRASHEAAAWRVRAESAEHDLAAARHQLESLAEKLSELAVRFDSLAARYARLSATPPVDDVAAP